MTKRIAVETLTLSEISDLFKQSLDTALPMAKGEIESKLKKLKRAKVSSHTWVKSYEIFKGAQLNFYCRKTAMEQEPEMSIGIIHRTNRGLISVDPSIKGLSEPPLVFHIMQIKSETCR